MSDENKTQEGMPEIDSKQFDEIMKAFAKVTVTELVFRDLNEFIQKAWENLGITLAYGEKEPKFDLAEAKTAIDCVEFLAGKIESKISEEENKSLKQVIANLQINYVKKADEKK